MRQMTNPWPLRFMVGWPAGRRAAQEAGVLSPLRRRSVSPADYEATLTRLIGRAR